ncbi:MAG: hypothetical protein Aureis2KO_13540 [Aureisphaera sp.]
MNYVVYILFSDILEKYYVGYTRDLEERMQRHNAGRSKFTSKGVPWRLIKTYPCNDRVEAVRLEKKIKKRGAKRFLDEN